MTVSSRLSTTDWAVLASLLECEAHGFRIAALFAPEGELGQIWRVQRAQVYRAIEHLLSRYLIEAVRHEEGLAGPPRTLYRATPLGQSQAQEWLNQPVTRLRYGRSDLRLKLAFLLRLEYSLMPLLQAQEAVYLQILHELEAQQPLQAQGVQRVSLLWRLEMARASLRFVEQMLEPEDATHN